MAPDFSDRSDFDDAERGFVATLEPLKITDAEGRIVFDLSGYEFLDGDCPDTVDPGLFRQSRLCVKNGLFEVVEGIYQIRGFDLSNMTLVEGDTGVIVIDPLVSVECAAAGLALYRKHRGERPVTGVIYTHSHGDHFGGVLGVLPDGAGDVPILAPAGFMAEAVSENVYAGIAMNRRGNYMYGVTLPVGPQGHVGAGLGLQGSTGQVSLLAPTLDVTYTGQTETLDGVPIVFQITPGTEAPSEMNFHFPRHRALCMAENATHTLHNLLTLRGAQVRDPRMWSHYLDEAIELFADASDVVFASHHWPTWGTDNLVRFVSQQRDLYIYLHDQTVRRMNQGMTGVEIAEEMTLPPALEEAWHARGYYGSVSHNVKAIYQRYLGWFDGHPSSLWQHPPTALAHRYVQVIGGIDAVVEHGRRFSDEGDLRFAAELLKHAVFADPDHAPAREALAEVYTRLGTRLGERHVAGVLSHRGEGTSRRNHRPRARPRRWHGRRTQCRTTLRHSRHPCRRSPSGRRIAVHRLAFHRAGPHDTDHAVQRRTHPHPRPAQRRNKGGSVNDTDQITTARPARRR